MKNKYSIIVMGCDEYHDIANLNALFLHKYWCGDCKIIYVTETILPNNSNYNVELKTKTGMKWSMRLLKALEIVDTPYVIMLCDDFLISRQVDFKKIDGYLDVCQEERLGCLKLMPAADKYEIIDEEFGNSKEGMYRITTMPAIWNVYYLKHIAELNVSAWDFELKGSQYSLNLQEDVWCTRRQEIEFVHAINKGKWEYAAIKLFKKESVPKELYNHRKTKSIFKHIYREVGGYVYYHFPVIYKAIRHLIYR